jgi:hypothetical protein
MKTTQITFGPSIRGVVIDGTIENLLGKRVRVTLSPDQVIIGRLGRNKFSNNTLCVTTGSGNEELYGKFFFEPGSARSIQEVL